MTEKSFYSHNQFFETEKEMWDYIEKWPDMECDVQCFKIMFEGIIRSLAINKMLNPKFTNRQAWDFIKLQIGNKIKD